MKHMSRSRLLTVCLMPAFAALVGFSTTPARGGALWGPITGADLPPASGSFQTTTTEFRWSFAFEQPPARVVQFDTTFMTAFGGPGRTAVEFALGTWQAGLAAAALPAGGRNGVNPAPAAKHDLESVAAHEIGHALGLNHPDEAAIFGRNFTPLVAAPFLGGAGAVPAGTEVLNSTIAAATTIRDLTMDDWATAKFLYDPMNANPPVVPEPAPGPIAGMGAVPLLPTGDDVTLGDIAKLGLGRDAMGNPLGELIDIFAADFSMPGVLPPEGQMDLMHPDSGGKEAVEIVRDPAGNPLAYTRIRFSYNLGGDGPGIIDGTPDLLGGAFADGAIVAGVDIVFNTDPMMVTWHIPEPATLSLLAVGGLALIPRRRRLLS